MLFDSHCHLNFKAYEQDLDEVVDRCRAAGMLLLNVGAAFDTSVKAVQLARQHDFCYASVGLHPIHVYDEPFEPAQYQKLIDGAHGRVRAVGETGFDFWRLKDLAASLDDVKEKQRQVFEQHIELAARNNLALILHARNGNSDRTAYKTIYEMVRDRNIAHGVIHCFGGDVDEALMFANIGFYIGFTGIVTFDTSGMLDEVLRALKLEYIVIETDAPYLAPQAYRGKRNEPVYVAEVAKHIARVKGLRFKEVVDVTGQNARKLYNIT